MNLHEWRYRFLWMLVLVATGIGIYLQFGWVVDTLSWSISKFDNKHLAFGIAIVILMVAVGIWIFLHFWRHRPWAEPIRQLSRTLQEIDGDTQHAPKDRIAKANEVFDLTEPQIKRLWQKYREHLQPDPQGPGYLNLIDPRIWFSVESLPGRGYEQWCGTWAGVFLTIGLLFTFIGLSAALLKVGGIADADSMAMKQAITEILGISSAKFITSIAGLLAYIGFSLVTRRYQSSQQAAARELADAIQHLSVPLTPELLLYEQNKTALKQLERMDRFTDDLAVAIDGKLENRLQLLSSEFGEHLGTIQQSLPSATAEPIINAIQNMTQAVAREFSTQLQQTAGGEINAVAVRLAEVAEKLASVRNEMGGVGEAFGNDIQTAAASLVDAAKQMSQGVSGQSSELEGKIGQFSSKLDNITATLTQVPGSIDSALNETLKKVTESISNISTSVGQVPAQIDAALNDTLTKLTNVIDALVKQIGEGGKNGAIALSVGGKEAGNRLKASVDLASKQFSEDIKSASSTLDASIENFAGRLQVVESSLRSLPEAVAAQVRNLNEAGRTFEEAGKTIVSSSTALRHASEPLQQTANAIQASLAQVRQKIDEANAIHQQTNQSVQAALISLKNTADSAQKTFTTHEEKFGKVDAELARALLVLRDGVDHVATKSSEIFNSQDQAIAKAIGQLSLMVQDLQDTLDDAFGKIN